MFFLLLAPTSLFPSPSLSLSFAYVILRPGQDGLVYIIREFDAKARQLKGGVLYFLQTRTFRNTSKSGHNAFRVGLLVTASAFNNKYSH